MAARTTRTAAKPQGDDIMPKGIHAKLNAILAVLAATEIKKTGKHSQYKEPYFTADDINNAVRPLLIQYGVNAYPRVMSSRFDEGFTVLDVTVTFVDVDTGDGVDVSGIGHGAQAKDKNGVYGDKGAKIAYTGALRYIYAKTFLLSDETDDELHMYVGYGGTDVSHLGDPIATHRSAPKAEPTNGAARPVAKAEPTTESAPKLARPLAPATILEKYRRTRDSDPTVATADQKEVAKNLFLLLSEEDSNTLQSLRDFFELPKGATLTAGAVAFLTRWSGYKDLGDGAYEVDDDAMSEVQLILQAQATAVTGDADF
jgi:hypothetical protein